MNMRNLLAAASTAITIMGAGAAGAVTVQSTNFIASPTFFNGFEAIASDPSFSGPYYFPTNTAYSEGGITVSYVGSGDLWTQYQYVGANGWYKNGGGTGYTDVTLTNGADFSGLQFLSGTGFGASTTYYQALNNGAVVSTGTLGAVIGGFGNSGLRYQGLSGGGFDEVRLQSSQAGSYGVGNFEAGAYDSFAATAAGGVPEPATWAMMLLGMGGLGAAMRGHRKLIALRSAAA